MVLMVRMRMKKNNTTNNSNSNMMMKKKMMMMMMMMIAHLAASCGAPDMYLQPQGLRKDLVQPMPCLDFQTKAPISSVHHVHGSL